MRCCLKTCPWLIQCQNHFCTAWGLLLPRISASTTGLRGMAGLLTMHFSFANAKLRLCALVRRNDVSKQNLESIVEFLGPLGNTQLTPLNLQVRHKMSRKSKRLPKCTFWVSLSETWPSTPRLESDALSFISCCPKTRPWLGIQNWGQNGTKEKSQELFDFCWQARNQTPGFLTISFANINKTRTQVEFCSVLGAKLQKGTQKLDFIQSRETELQCLSWSELTAELKQAPRTRRCGVIV